MDGSHKASGMRRIAIAASILAAFTAALLASCAPRAPAAFHDMRVIRVSALTSLVDPEDPAVRSLAERLGTPEAAYAYVRDRIIFKPMTPAGPPGETLRKGAASCLGKATLLCSLYRAMGISAGDVRIITGNVVLRDAIADHAWIDLEYKGSCLQQDPSGFLGHFGFMEFRGMEFTHMFVEEETYCFNDEGFAVISQLNRFRYGLPAGPGGMPPAPSPAVSGKETDSRK